MGNGLLWHLLERKKISAVHRSQTFRKIGDSSHKDIKSLTRTNDVFWFYNPLQEGKWNASRLFEPQRLWGNQRVRQRVARTTKTRSSMQNHQGLHTKPWQPDSQSSTIQKSKSQCQPHQVRSRIFYSRWHFVDKTEQRRRSTTNSFICARNTKRKTGSRGTWATTHWAWRHRKNQGEVERILFLAKHGRRHRQTHSGLPKMSTAQRWQTTANIVVTLTTMHSSKPEGSHWLVWTIEDIWQRQENGTMYDRRIYQICGIGSTDRQRGRNNRRGYLQQMDLQIWHTIGNRFRQWKRVQKQVGGRIVQKTGHWAHHNSSLSSTMQCASRGMQQNNCQIFKFICGWNNFRLGTIFGTPGIFIQHQPSQIN